MIQDFAKRKFDEYVAMVEFPAGRINLSNILNSKLPVYISNFIINCPSEKNLPINKIDFENFLNKAIIFNINYIIKPKHTILQFLFGELEARPVFYILNRLQFFQFYEFYISSINNFINVNNLQIVSKSQIELLINQINNIILEEISTDKTGANQLNLIKLLYYFFYDLTDNTPINIKLPKKILSAFFTDKNFFEIKKRIDSFFSNDIFIQEAVDLMKPDFINYKQSKNLSDEIDEKVENFIKQAKEKILNAKQTESDIKIVINDEEINGKIKIKLVKEHPNINNFNTEQENNISFENNSFSHDLTLESQLSKNILSPEIINLTKIDDLFFDITYKKKIIKKIFKNNEKLFNDFVNKILLQKDWESASELINKHYINFKINLFIDEAVKFIDILQDNFIKD